MVVFLLSEKNVVIAQSIFKIAYLIKNYANEREQLFF